MVRFIIKPSNPIKSTNYQIHKVNKEIGKANFEIAGGTVVPSPFKLVKTKPRLKFKLPPLKPLIDYDSISDSVSTSVKIEDQKLQGNFTSLDNDRSENTFSISLKSDGNLSDTNEHSEYSARSINSDYSGNRTSSIDTLINQIINNWLSEGPLCTEFPQVEECKILDYGIISCKDGVICPYCNNMFRNKATLEPHMVRCRKLMAIR